MEVLSHPPTVPTWEPRHHHHPSPSNWFENLKELVISNEISLKRSTSDALRYEPSHICCVCMEDFPQITPSPYKELCDCEASSTECFMCEPCGKQFYETWLENAAKFAIVPPKCLGCNAVVFGDKWIELMGCENYTKYTRNMEKNFMIRCPSCDEDNGMTLSSVFDGDITEADLPQEVTAHPEIISIVREFETYAASATDVIELMDEKLDERQIAALFGTIQKGDQSKLGEKHDGCVLKLMSNPERRCALLLQYFKTPNLCQPNTTCCFAEVCMNCRFDGYHEGETCEQVIERTKDEEGLNEEVYSCPNCYVNFVHSGGCTSMRCVMCLVEFEIDEHGVIDGSVNKEETDEED